MPAYAPTWALPRPFKPATAMRIASLAPRTRPDDLVPAMVIVAIAAREPFTKLRLVILLMVAAPSGGGETVGGLYRYIHPARRVQRKITQRRKAAKGEKDGFSPLCGFAPLRELTAIAASSPVEPRTAAARWDSSDRSASNGSGRPARARRCRAAVRPRLQPRCKCVLGWT